MDGLGVRESGRRRRSGASQSSTVLIILLLLGNSVSEMWSFNCLAPGTGVCYPLFARISLCHEGKNNSDIEAWRKKCHDNVFDRRLESDTEIILIWFRKNKRNPILFFWAREKSHVMKIRDGVNSDSTSHYMPRIMDRRFYPNWRPVSLKKWCGRKEVF